MATRGYGRNGRGAARRHTFSKWGVLKPRVFGRIIPSAITARNGTLPGHRFGVPPSGGGAHANTMTFRTFNTFETTDAPPAKAGTPNPGAAHGVAPHGVPALVGEAVGRCAGCENHAMLRERKDCSSTTDSSGGLGLQRAPAGSGKPTDDDYEIRKDRPIPCNHSRS